MGTNNKALFIIAVFLVTISCANANLLVNGFFEDGPAYGQFGSNYPDGWEGYGSGGWHHNDKKGVGSSPQEPDDFIYYRHDDFGITIWERHTLTGLFQRFSVTPGEEFTCSANLMHRVTDLPNHTPLVNRNGVVEAQFWTGPSGFYISATSIGTLTPGHSLDTWHHFTNTFTVPGGTGEMRIACVIKDTGGGPSGKAYYDDIILTTDTFNVPETDFDDDGHVTLADFGGISGKWQEVSAKYDMTGDGLINIDDFKLFAIEWLEDTTTKNGYDLVWYDGFNGTSLATSNWFYDIGNGSGGWGNNEKQYYTSRSENIRLEDGNLVIEAKEESYGGQDYTSAKIHTYGKVSVLYGRIEARIKISTSQGLWPAFWMMPVDNTYYGDGWPANGEIDIMESVNYKNETVGMLHYGRNDGSGYVPDSTWWAPGYTNDPIGDNLSDDFHVYAVEWDVTEMRWYVDDVLFFTAYDYEWWTGGSGSASAPFDRDFYLILNVAVGGRWPKNPDNSSIFPQKMLVDYVKIYD